MGGAESAGRRVFVFCKVVFPEKQLSGPPEKQKHKKRGPKASSFYFFNPFTYASADASAGSTCTKDFPSRPFLKLITPSVKANKV